MKQKVLIFGAGGMLGRVFFETQKNSIDIIPLTRSDTDITEFPLVLNQISIHEPDIILNFAAYTDVDLAEGRNKLQAFQTNTLWAQNIAKAASAFGIPLIFLSSDYVFDGENENGYIQSDSPNPLNIYGMSKYLGEELSKREYAETIIVRTSSLYGWPLFGNSWAQRNFINSLQKQNLTWKWLQVVNDSFTVPTSCIDLSEALKSIIDESEFYEGLTLHLINDITSGEFVSWYDFALEIGKYLPLGLIEKIDTNNYPRVVKRPKYAILKNTSKIRLPAWRTALRSYFESV